MRNAEHAVQAESLSFSYDETPVLREIDLTVSKGEFLSLLGPNGAGKTTLFNLLSGLYKPVVGAVKIFGRNIGTLHQKEKARLLGVVPQETTANFDFTNLEIVLMGRVVHTSRFGNESADDIREALAAMKRTETEHLAHRGFMEVSGGEKQRVVLAQVLAQETSIMLLDEPTSKLDINYQIEIMQLIKDIKKERDLTVIAIFHDMNLAAQFADRIVFIKEGRIVGDDTPEEILTPHIIRSVYNARVMVERDPHSDKPLIVPLYHFSEEDKQEGATP